MKKVIVGILVCLCGFAAFGSSVILKVDNTSMYGKLKVECLKNGQLVSSKEIFPHSSGKIEIPVEKENENYAIKFTYPTQEFSISLNSERDHFGKNGLRFSDDYTDDNLGLTGDLRTDELYYNNIDLKA